MTRSSERYRRRKRKRQAVKGKRRQKLNDVRKKLVAESKRGQRRLQGRRHACVRKKKLDSVKMHEHEKKREYVEQRCN